MNRRKFLKCLGIAPTVLTAPSLLASKPTLPNGSRKLIDKSEYDEEIPKPINTATHVLFTRSNEEEMWIVTFISNELTVYEYWVEDRNNRPQINILDYAMPLYYPGCPTVPTLTPRHVMHKLNFDNTALQCYNENGDRVIQYSNGPLFITQVDSKNYRFYLNQGNEFNV